MDSQNSPTIKKKRNASFLKSLLIVAISFLLTGLSDSLMAQVTYYSQGNLNPAALASWNTIRTGGGAAPANFTSGDIFVVQGTGGGLGAPHSMNVTGNWNITPNNTTGRIIIESGATLSLTTANVTTPAVQVEGTLNVNAGRTFTLTNGSSVPDLLVNATGVINNSNNFTMNAGTTGNVSGIYYHNVNGGTIPNVGMTWNAGSLCEITGVTTTVPAGINQNFAHFTWNCATQSANITATLNANIQGNLSIQQTNGFDFILNNNINLNNNNLNVGANGILSCLNNLITLGTGTATVNGTIRTTNANGFYGAANTTIVNSPTIFLNAGSTIDYNANGAQNISATLTYSNLSTSIGGVKTLANNVTVNGNLSIGAGTTLQVANRDLNVSGLTTIIGTLADNNATGVTNLQNVDMQGGTIDHTVIDDVNILGSLTASSGSSTLANANIVVSGATLINAGATLVISGTSTKNFNNSVTNNGTWTTSGAPNITIGGNLSNDGTMSQTGTGTYFFTTTSSIGGNQPITFQGPVTVSGAITLTNSNNAGVTFQGALTGTLAGSTFTNNATMYYAHNSIPMGARPFNANAAGNNVYYSLGGDQPVRNVTYANLFISGSGTKTAAGAFTVQGNLNIAVGTTLADGGNLITANGNVTNYGSATGTGGIRITGGTPPHIITGNGYYQRLDINSNSTMSAAAASISVDNLVLSAGSLGIDNNTLTVNNTLNVAGGTLTTIAAQSNITFNGTAAINMPASVTALNNFTLNNTVGSSLSASLTVNGTLTLTNGALTYANPNVLTIYSGPTVVNGFLTGGINTVLRTAGTSNITLPANLVQTGGTIDLEIQNTGGLTSNIPRVDDITIAVGCTLTLGSDIAVTGNMTNAGTYNGTGRITTFNRVGAGNQTLSGAGAFNFGSIVINTSNQLVLAQNINVYGDWDLNAGGFSGNFEVSFIGTSPQDIGGILSTTFYRLRTTNTLLTISNNQTVTNRLRFDGSGKITLGNSDLIIANPATISNNSNTRFVITNGNGRLVRSGAIAAGFVFPVGNSSASANYAPVTFAAAGSNNVGVRAIGNKHPDNPSSADYLNRYWAITTLAGGNLAAGNFTFTYSSGLVGSPQSAYYYGGTWTSSGGSAASPFTIALPALAAGDAIDVSGIDFVQPSVVSVTPSTTMVSDANIGANGFYLDIVYSESMDPAYTPVVSFPTAGENPAPTLSFSSGVWINATTYRAYYNVTDFNLVMTNIDVSVGDGRDLVGNIQNPNPHNALNLFSIDMFCVSASAGPDQHVCETVPGGLTANITMNASLPGAGTGTWSYSGPGMGAFSNINSNTTAVTNLQPGVHSFTWTITGGACPGSDIVVIYNDQPTPANAGVDQPSVCNGTATLGANAPPIVGIGSWTGPFGVTFDNSTVYNTVARNLLSGVNVLTWTITNGACSSTDNVNITNNQVTVADAGADQVLCTNSTALSGNTPISGSGIWTVVSGGATIINNTLPGTVVTNLQRRDNILRWTITRGTCSSFDEVRISNYSVIANAGLDDYTCDGTYQLQGNNPATQNITIPNLPATGTWSTVGPTNITNINLYNTGINNMDLDANTYKWTVTNGVCTSEDEVVISNDMPSLPSAGPDATFCGVDFAPSGYNSIYNSLTANAPNYARGEVGVWTQVAGSGTFLDDNTTTNLRVDDLAQYAQLSGPDFWSLNPTVNTFRWTITYKLCELYDEVTITNAAPNLADAGPDQTVCFDEVNLNAEDHGSRAQTHVWTIQSPAQTVEIINDPNQWNTYVQFLQSATTTFRWTKTNVINGLTCVVWDETEVIKTNNTGRPNAGPPQIVCSTEADLAATSLADIGFPTTDDVIGSWAVLDGNAVFADVNSPSTHVTNLAYQRNVLRWTITNNTQGCIATADAYVTNALPSNANAGPDQFVCTNTALLSADRPTRGSGSWSVIGGSGTISNATCQSFLCTAYVSGMGTGQNTFLWTMSNTYTDPASLETKTCILTDEIEVWNNAVTADAGLDLTVCVDNATLGATPPDPGKGETGFWVRTGGSATVVNPTLFNTTVTGLSPDGNTFRWTLSNAYCSSSDFMTITNNNPTDPVASTPNPNTCDGNATVNGNNPLNGTGLWSVFAGGGTITNPSLTSTTVTGMPLGPNTYRWTITKQGCAESADVVVTNRAVVADAGADIDNVCGIEPAISNVTLIAVEPNLALGQSGNWTVVTSAGTIITPTFFNTQVTGMDNGTNTFRWTLTNGVCTDNDEVSVFVYIPTTANAGADYETCADLADARPLTGNTPAPGRGFGTWSLVGTGSGNIAVPSNAVTTVSNLGPDENVFRWTINHNGCLSQDQVTITNNFVTADAGPDDLICVDNYTLAANDPQTFNGGFAYPSGQWNTIQGTATYANPTLYNTTITNLSTSETNIYRWTVTKGICSASDEVEIINNRFSISAGPDQTVCDDFAFLDAQQPGTGTGTWSLISGGGTFVNSTLYNTRVNGLSTNPNIFRWTVARNGCTAFDEVTVYNNKVTSNAGLPQRVCDNFATLDGNDPSLLLPAGATGNWVATIGGASISDPSLRNTLVTNLADGQNTFQWTISRTLNSVTCQSSSLVNIFNDTPSDAVVEADNEVCSYSTQLSVLNIPTIGSGTWTAVDNLATFDNPSSLNVTVNGLNRGINTFRWTVTNLACSDFDDVVITNNVVSANAGLDKTTACADFTNLPGSVPVQGNGVWTDLSGSGATIISPTLNTTLVTGLPQGNTDFRWTVTLGSCTSSDDVRITNNQITASAGADQVICNDFYSPLDGNDVSLIGGTGIWESVGTTAVITNLTLFNTGVTGLDPGLNTFRWTVTSGAEGCTDSDEVGITNASVIANAGTDFETCNSIVTLGAQDPAPASGFWTQASGNPAVIVNSTSHESQITGLTGGVYAFTWTVSNGSCSNTSTVIITNSSPQLAVANTGAPEVCNSNGSVVGNALLVGESGLWTIPSGSGIITNNTINNTTVTNLGLGNNTFRWTITKGTDVSCTSSAEVTITNNTVSANAGPDQDICNNTTNLAATAPAQGTGVWSKFGINPAVITDQTLRTSSVTGLSDNSSHGFTWTVSLGSCSTSDDVYINNNRVLADAGSNQSTCNSSINLDGNDVSSLGASGNWSLVTPGPAQISNASQYNTFVTNLGSGLNIFRWTVTSTKGCVSSDDVGITYNYITANAGLAQETCNSAVTMAAGNPAPGTGTWSQVSGNPASITDATLATTSITGLTSGDYTFRWTVLYNGCTASSDVIVTNSAPQNALANTPSPEVCNNTGSLIGSALLPGERGLWTIPSGSGIIANNTLNNTTVSNLGLGSNTFRWTITKGTNVSCTSSAEVTITNNTVSANAGSNQDICTNTTNLAATSPTQGTGVWSKFGINPAVITDPTLRTSGVTGLADNTSHGFTWTVSLGSCTASDDVYINNNRVLADAGTDQATCNSSINLDGNDVSTFGATGNWTLVTPGPAQISNSSQYNTLVTDLGNGLNIFRWTVTSAQGCVSSDDVGITYNYITANAGLAQETCNSAVTMAAGNPAPGTGTWSQVSGNPASITDATLATTSITGLTSGDYTFRWTVLYNGCTASSDVIVTNSAPQNALANTPSPEVCNNTGSLIGSALLPGERGLWTIPSGSGIIANNTLNNTTVSNLGLGSNTFRWTITKGTNVSCTSSAEVTITNNTVSANAGSNQDICTNTTNLAATSPTQGTGVWSKFGINPAVITDPTLRTSGVTGLADNTSHGFTWTVSLGSCTASDDVYINNNRVLADAGTDQATCNSSINLDGNDVSTLGATGNWTLVTPGPSIIASSSQYNTLVTDLGSGLNIFRWTVTSAKGCISSDDVGITYNYISANAGLPQETCNTSVTLGAGDPSPGTGIWTQVSGNPATISDATLANTPITGLTSGSYTFRWTVLYSGCTATSDVIITNSAPQTALANTPSPEVCNGNGTLVGNAVLLGESGLWTLLSGTGDIANPSSNNTSVSNLGPGNNLFRWTIRKGITTTCSSFADVTITNNQVSAFAFTPNTVSCDATATLGANDPSVQSATGLWTVSTGAVISDPTSNSITATNLAAGNNIFTWTVTRGSCVASSSVTISNNQVVATVGGDISLCGSSTNLNAFDPTPNTGLWTLETGDNPAAIVIDNPGLFNTAVSGISKTAIFKWKVTGVSCKDSAYVTVNNNSITISDGAPQTICSSNANLIAGALAPGQSGLWTSAGVNPVIANQTSTTTAISNLDNGTNIFFWTVTNSSGCSGSGRYDVINDSPSQPDAGANQDLCASSGALNANTPTYGTGEWKQVGGSPLTVIANPLAASTTVSNLGTGATTFVWLITNNSCSLGDSVVLNNNLFNVATANNKAVCTDVSDLGVVQGFPGTWTKISGSAIIANSTDPNTTVSNLSFGANTFLWTVNNGSCVVSDEMTITNNSPEVPITEVNKTVCQVSGVSISANTPTYGTGTWTNVGGGTATIVNPTSSNTTVNNLINGANTLRWTLSYNGCTRDDDLIITSYAAIALAGSDESLCGNSTSLNAVAPAYGTGNWSVISGSAIVGNSLDPKSSVSNLSQGANIFRWTVNNVSCSGFDEVTITNNAPDIANAGGDIPICTNTVNLNGNNPTVGIGTWTTTTTSAIIDNPGLYNTSVTVPLGSTVFRWTIRNNGCESFDEVTVNNNSLTVNVNPDGVSCDGTFSLLGTNPALVGTGTGTGTWTVVGGSANIVNQTSYSTIANNLLATGSRESVFRWTVVDGACSASKDVKVVNDQVTASNSGFMTCNSSVPILANDPSIQGATGLWIVENPQGQVIANPSSFSTTVSNLRPGTINRLNWIVTRNTCSASDTMNIEYFVPNANITIPDIPFSCTDTVQLIADANLGGGSGVWSLKFGSLQVTIDNPTNTTTIARNLEIGNNVFVWTVSNRGCTSYDEVSINNSKPLNSAGSDQAACNNTFTMNAQSPTTTGSGLWQTISGTVSYADMTSPTTSVVVGAGTNILQWTITDNGCSNPKLFYITNNLTTPNAGEDVSVCENRVRLSGSSLKPGESGLWSIDGGILGELFSSTSVNNPEVTNLRQGNTTFAWTVTNGICTAVDRVVVTNNTPLVDAGPDRIICENLVTLEGNNPASGSSGLWTIGNANVNISNPTAYNSTVTNLSKGSNLFTWTINNGICTASDNVLITSNSIDVVAGLPYTEACSDTLVLTGTQPPLNTNGFWTAVEGGGTFDNATSYSTIARNLTGYNKLRWTIVSGSCSYYNDLVFVSLLPTKANTETDKLVCSTTTQINANAPGAGETGRWDNVIGTATFENRSNFQTNVNNLVQGVNVFKWTISNNLCSTSDLLTINNNQVFADAGQDKTMCDSSYTLSANLINGTGVWTANTPGVIIANSTSPNTNVTNLNFGSNSFSWTVTYSGCSATDEVILTSNLPRDVSAGSDQNICSGSTNLAGTNPGFNGTGQWTLTGGAGVFENPTSNQTVVSGLATGENIFRWTVTVGSCSASSQVRINNNSLYVTAGTDQVVCNTDQLQLSGTQPGAGITGTWSVNGGAGTFDNPTVFNTIVRNFTKGTNTFVWTLTDGSCTNSAQISVVNDTPDSAKVGNPQFICTDNTTINAIAVSNGFGTWSLKSGSATIVNPSSNNTLVTGLIKGLNTFTWTVDKNGCKLSADIDVTNNSVNAYISNKEVTICTPTHTATIIGSPINTGETGTWTKTSAGNGIITNSNSNVTTVTNLDYGNTFFRWTVSNGSCSSSDEVRVTNNYYNLTTASVAGSPILCVDYADILGSIWPSGASGSWSSTAPDVTFDNNTSVSTIARNLPQGTSAITWTITKDGCASPASFNLVNNSILTSAGIDKVICQTSTNLNALSLLTGQTGVWTVDNGSVTIADLNSPTTLVTDLITGNNTFTWTVTGSSGCTAVDAVVISNNAFTVTAGTNNISCGPSYTLSGSDPLTGSGLWTVNSGFGSFANPTNYQTDVNGMSNGPNTFTWTVKRNGCTASANVTITNDSYPAVVGADRSVCTSSTTVTAQPLNPTSGATGFWTVQTGSGTFANPTSYTTPISGLSLGDNVLRWTVSKGMCFSFDELVISNRAITASAGTDETTCDNFITLNATPLNANETGTWSSGGLGIVFDTPHSPSTLVSNLNQGLNTFAWYVRDTVTNCNATSTVRVTSNFFSPYAGPDMNVILDSYTMQASTYPAGSTGVWSLVSGNGNFADPVSPTSLVSNLGFGNNTFRWTVTWNGCTYFDDVEISYSTIFADAGRDTFICGPTWVLQGNNPAPYGTGVWTKVSGTGIITNSTNPVTTVTDIKMASVNIFRWTVTVNQYTTYDDVMIINKQFNLSAGINKSVCTDSVVLSADPAGNGTGVWSILSGSGAFSDLNDPNATVTNLDESNNVFQWTVSKTNGCTNSDIVEIFYNTPPIANFEMDKTEGCSPLTVNFTNTTSGGSYYYWNFGNDQRTDTALIEFSRTYEALYLTDSTYSISLTAYDDAGCSNTITKTVTAFMIPKVDFSAYPESQYFPGSTVHIENYSGTNYPNYYWTFGDGGTQVDNSYVPLVEHEYATWGTYEITLTVSSVNCQDTARQFVHILAPKPVNNGGRPYAECEPLTVNFDAATLYADRWYWEFGNLGTSTQENPTFIFDSPGQYIVSLWAWGPGGPNNGQDSVFMRTDTVTVYPRPEAFYLITPDSVMLPNQPIHCYNRSTYGETFEWDFGVPGQLAISTQENPIYYYTTPGTYYVTLRVWSEHNCFDTYKSPYGIVVEPPGVCKFPNAFSPNPNGPSDGRWVDGDVSNDIFHPVFRGVREYKLEIFNRWGEKIFESNNAEIGWDGYVDGKLAAQDVYVWKVTGKYKNGVIFKDAGDVTLMR